MITAVGLAAVLARDLFARRRLVLAIALLLGLRHATDPDHVAAVTTLGAGDGHGDARLGLAWGAGHGTSLFAFGVPIVLYRAYLPEAAQVGAEAAVGIVIVALARRLVHARCTEPRAVRLLDSPA